MPATSNRLISPSLIKEGKAVKPGKMDLVCGTEVSGIASHESCGHPIEADRILGREMSQAGRSFIYKDGPYWIGTRIGSDIVTIVDDPTVANSYGHYEYDDEGIRAQRRFLYKNGVINEFLHNRETAAKLGTRSNGSSRSVNYDREAIVRMANTFLLPGDWTEEEIIEDVKNGIYMKSFTEWNIDDRRFNQRYVGREAYLIENGELKHPVARPVIETTTESWWSAVDAISKRVKYLELKTRRAKAKDAKSISFIWEVVCAERIYTSVDKAFTAQQESEYISSLSEREAIFVAEIDNKIVGFQTIDLWSKILTSFRHVGSIGTFILPKWRGQGISYILANQTFDFARANDYTKIVIYVRKGNERAIKFYQNLGFITKGELEAQVNIDGIMENEVFMEKFL